MCWSMSPARSSSARAWLLEAFKHGKDVVLMNAEIDATIGPILQTYAAKHGVILSACDGDEPGVQINLYRWVKGLGLTPRVIGNIKGLAGSVSQSRPRRKALPRSGDRIRRWSPASPMVRRSASSRRSSPTPPASKSSSRGMSRGMEYKDDVMKIGKIYDIDEVRKLGGIVDYVVGTPLTKVYVSGRASRSEAAALSQSLQDGRRAAVFVLHAVSPGALRSAERDCARGAVPRLVPSRWAVRWSKSAPWPSAT